MDQVHKRMIKISYFKTDDMRADILTKPLQGSSFQNCKPCY